MVLPTNQKLVSVTHTAISEAHNTQCNAQYTALLHKAARVYYTTHTTETKQRIIINTHTHTH